jgi:antitoxin MazE
MLKKLVSHGNSAALIIDKPILELLKVDMDTPLEITTDGNNLLISPVRDGKRGKKFLTALETVNRKHGLTLGRLAK